MVRVMAAMQNGMGTSVLVVVEAAEDVLLVVVCVELEGVTQNPELGSRPGGHWVRQ